MSDRKSPCRSKNRPISRALPLDQFYSPVFGLPVVCVVRCDGRIRATPERREAAGGNTEAGNQRSNYICGAAATEVEIVVGRSLIVGVADNLYFQLRVSAEELGNFLQCGLRI